MSPVIPAVAALWMSLAVAVAHDPYEITADGRVRPESFKLLVTMARSTATELAGDGTSRGVHFDPSEFDARRPTFERMAQALFNVEVGGKAIPLRDVSVRLSRENDIELALVYSLAPGKTLKLDAVFLRRLPPEGYGAAVTLLSRETTLLDRKLLTIEDPAMEVALPAAEGASPPALPPSSL